MAIPASGGAVDRVFRMLFDWVKLFRGALAAMSLSRAPFITCAVTTMLVRAAGGMEPVPDPIARDRHEIRGWTVLVSRVLRDAAPDATAQAITLLDVQLAEIERVVPAAAVAKLRKVPLYFSPEYENTRPRAEYHPKGEWLRDHGRDSAMARAVEFTNVRIFAEEIGRMPNFTLHELAHAYHHQCLPDGFENRDIHKAFERGKSSGNYDHVARHNGNGRSQSVERAYALTTPQEFFAETSEAFFSRNDFFPFTRDDLRRLDPETAALLSALWGVADDAIDRR